MAGRLSRKIALITGAAGGAELPDDQGRVTALPNEIASEVSLTEVAPHCVAPFGGLTIWVNNAGLRPG